METDHKPLIGILNKPINECTPRIQRIRLRLLRYDFSTEHIAGKTNVIADVLSRSGVTDVASRDFESVTVEKHALSVVVDKPFASARLAELSKATQEDESMVELSHCIHNGWPESVKEHSELRNYWNLRHDLTQVGDLILYKDSLVIPQSMRQLILARIHDGHLGQVKCTDRARGHVFWPGITADIRQTVASCPPCQVYQNQNAQETRMHHEKSETPWTKVGIDIFHFSGHQYLLIADYTSGFVEIVKLQGTTTAAVIVALKSVFARYGVPLVLVSDNERKLISFEMKQFLQQWGVELNTSSPYIPRSNGLAERNIQTVKKILKKSLLDGSDPYLGLLGLRATPLASGQSPAELFFNRKIRTTLTSFKEESLLDSLLPKPESKFSAGDMVNIYNMKTKRFDKQGTVTAVVAPQSVQVQTERGSYRRNHQHLRRSESILPANIRANNGSQGLEQVIGNTDEELVMYEGTSDQTQSEPPRVTESTPEPMRQHAAIPETRQYTRRGRAINKPIRYR